MAIHQILGKEYKKQMRDRKVHGSKHGTHLFFKAANGKYYKCDRIDMLGVKEMTAFQKAVKENVGTQTSLI